MAKQAAPPLWWLESPRRRVRSQGLQSTLTALDEKAKAMLNLIEQDADSFAQRAEMFYKKRPQLIAMVEDFYRAHCSLAMQSHQAKADPSRPTLSIPSFIKTCASEPSDCCSETNDQSDVDDPPDVEVEGAMININDVALDFEESDEVKKLREEIAMLKEVSRVQKEELVRKDEEKREAIRQLCVAMQVLKEGNTNLKARVGKISRKEIGSKWAFWKN